MGLFSATIEYQGLELYDCDIPNFVSFDIQSFYDNANVKSMIDDAFYHYLMICEHKRSYRFCIYHGYLCLFHVGKTLTLVTIPFDKRGHFMGPRLLAEFCRLHNIKSVSLTTDVFARRYTDEFKAHKVNAFGTYYVYDNEAFASMEGSGFAKLRQAVNRYKKYYGFEYELYKPEYFDDYMNLYARWCVENSDKYKDGILDKYYYKESLVHQQELDYKCIGVRDADGLLIGMAGYIPIGKDVGYCMNRKSILKYEGLPEYMQLVDSVLAWADGVRYMYDSCDGDKPGMKYYKAKLNPCITFRASSLVLKEP